MLTDTIAQLLWDQKNMTQNHELPLVENTKSQTISFFTLKMKTSTIAYIKSKDWSRSRAAPESSFVRPWHVKSLHPGHKPHFIFLCFAR